MQIIFAIVNFCGRGTLPNSYANKIAKYTKYAIIYMMSESLKDYERFNLERENAIPEYILKGIGRFALDCYADTLPKIDMRNHQIEAWRLLHEHRDEGNDKALLHMATGLGKTIVVAGDILSFSDEFILKNGRNPKVLFLAHQIELLNQAKNQFDALLPDFNSSIISSESTDKIDDSNDFVYATLQSMNTQRENFPNDYFEYVVVDESHHAMAPNFKDSIEYFKPIFRLGVTATPFRKDEKDLSELFGEIVYSKNLAEAVSDKLLDAPEYTVVGDELLQNNLDSKLMNSREMEEALFDINRNTEMAKIITEKQESIDNPKTIIFAKNIAHAEDFSRYIDGASVLHSDLADDVRRNVISKFRSGDIKTIIAVDMLNEGVDIPEANLAVFLRSTASRTIFEQQLGRILRKVPGKSSHVLDFVGTGERLAMIYELSEEVRRINEMKISELGYDSSNEIEYDRFGVIDLKFDKWTMDIIEKIKKYTLIKQPAPEGWMNIGQIADILNKDIFQIYSYIRQNNIETVEYKSPTNYSAKYLSPEDAANFINMYQNPDKWISIKSLETMIGWSDSYLREYINKNDINVQLFVSENGKLGGHISPEDVQKITDEHAVLNAPDGWTSASDLAMEFKVERLVIKRAIRRLGLNALKYATSGHNQIGLHISPSDADKVREFLNPVGWTSLQELGSLVGRPAQQIKKTAKKQKMEIVQKITVREDGGKIPVDHISDDDAMLIIDHYHLQTLEYAPDDVIEIADIANEYNLGVQAIAAMAKKFKLDILLYKNTKNNLKMRYLSQDSALVIRNFYDKKVSSKAES